jgi:nitronate monooxygenase
VVDHDRAAAVSVLGELAVPIVLAPLAGGPSTPELAAAVTGAGGLGFVAAGYKSAAAMGEDLVGARSVASGPYGVNVFCPSDRGPADPAAVAAYAARVASTAAAVGGPVGEPRFDDDDYSAKLEALLRLRPAVVSFTFGCPAPEVVGALQEAGVEVWVTVTSPGEALAAGAAGADGLAVQGVEAGGHRGTFVDEVGAGEIALLPLLALVRAAVDLPLVAAGGITGGAGVAAVLAAGASAAQLGTAFLRCPEAGTSEVHRRAVAAPGATGLTRAFSGRLARGIVNAFQAEHSAEAPSAYPEIHHVTAPLRAHGRAVGNADLVNLWAGEGHELGSDRPAAEIVASFAADAQATLAKTTS